MKLKRLKGQMLIEIVVAIGILALVLVGVSDLITRSSKVVTFQKHKEEALGIIQGMLNSYRSQRDSNPQGFYDTAANEVFDPCVVNKPYKCTVIIEKTPEAVLVTVTAEWIEGGQTYNVSLSQSLLRDIFR